MLEEIQIKQNKASNPEYSIWTNASAGSGKTTILSKRLVRMLLSGIEPSKILCITFTNTGAVEMRNRVNSILSKWASIKEEELKKEIINLEGSELNIDEKIKTARTLFAKILDNNNDFKILTIHSFCQQIIKRFPLEANIIPNFQIADEITSAELLTEAKRELLKTKNEEIKKAIQYIFTFINEDQFLSILKKAVGQKDNLLYIKSKFFTIDGVLEEIKKILQIEELSYEKIINDFCNETNFNFITQEMIDVINNKGGVFDKKFIKTIDDFKQDRDLVEEYIDIFLKSSDGLITSRLITKDTKERFPELDEFVLSEADRAFNCRQYLNNLANFEFTSSFLKIIYYIFEIYSFLKKEKGCLDYNDLIFETNNLLNNQRYKNIRGENNFSSWINYKLDEGVDHILIDEAQDTSATQWDIIKAITDEFFSGYSTQEEKKRTIFVVGDEKQSIFSFQGAEPENFNIMLNDYRNKILNSQNFFEEINLRISFRSLNKILSVVDDVFSEPKRQNSISKLNEKIQHKAFRENTNGKVEIWPLIEEKDLEEEVENKDKDSKKEKKKKEAEDWDINYLEKIEVSSKQKLAKCIADEIDYWFKEGKIIIDRKTNKKRKLKYSDIMILVKSRKNKDFINYLVRELNKRKIPNMGNDRFDLIENIVSRDIVSLLKFIVFNEDDLSLANIIKSPFLDLNENDLYELCDYKNENNITLWQSLQSLEKYKNKKEFLEDIIEKSKNSSLYELLFYIFETKNTKKEIMKRFQDLGYEIIKEFLNIANNYENNHNNTTLLNFIDFIQNTNLEIKRDMEQISDEIKIITAHSSKGLESPIVILTDTNHSKSSINKIDELLKFKEKGNDYYLPFLKKEKSLLLEEIKENMQMEVEEEYLRLLYVAMTRAENELYICDYKKKKNEADNSWYSILFQTIKNNEDVKIKSSENIEGEILYIGDLDIFDKDFKDEEKKKEENISINEIEDIRKILNQTKKEKDELLIINPSIYYQDNLIKTPSENNENLENGKLIHKLLEILPNIEKENREEIINIYTKNSKNKDKINEIITNILNNKEFNFLFSTNSKAEVPIFGKINEKEIVSGTIDRISIIDNIVHIIDYKTTNNLPQTTPEKYKTQLNLYKKILQKIYPDKEIKTYILWTSFGKIEYVS